MPYRYRWDSPEMTPSDLWHVGLVEPGQEFESEEPVNHPYATLLPPQGKAKTKEE